MKNNEILSCIEYIDEKLIDEYDAAKPTKQKLVLKLLPVAACLALIVAAMPMLNHHNAPDKRYEATHKSFDSVSEAAEVIGDDYLFTKLGDKDRTEITLAIVEGGSFDERSDFTDLEYYAADGTETVNISVFLPSYAGKYPDHLWIEKSTAVIGETTVTYCDYGKGSAMSDDYYFAAEFEYGGNRYEYLFSSSASAGNAFVYLNDMLGK